MLFFFLPLSLVVLLLLPLQLSLLLLALPLLRNGLLLGLPLGLLVLLLLFSAKTLCFFFGLLLFFKSLQRLSRSERVKEKEK